MAHANWGRPGAGYPEHSQGSGSGGMPGSPSSQPPQDPAWHGQPPLTRAAPPVTAQPERFAPTPQADPYASVRPTPGNGYYAEPEQPAPGVPMRPGATPVHQQAPAPAEFARDGVPTRPQPLPDATYQAQPAPQPAPQSVASRAEPAASAYYAAPQQPQNEPRRERGGGFVALAGAATSVALVLGLGVWGYNLAMRDVTDVPVVAALEGPMRVQPESPGGVSAEHQGLAVNNVAAEGAAEGPADQLVLAPAVADLDPADVPIAANPEIRAVSAEADEVPAQLGTAPLDASLTGDEAEKAVLALVEEITGSATPLDTSPDRLAAPIAPDDAGDVIAATVPGVAISPRPKPRPGALVARAEFTTTTDALLTDPAAAVETTAFAEVDPTAIPVGTRLVQLGAYDSVAVARAEWTQLANRFADNMEGKSRVIEQAQSGGKVFYRLRAMGFDDLTDARRFCAALMSGQAACIPVVTR